MNLAAAPVRDTTIIAVVDDDDAVRSALKTLLRSVGYTVRTYCNAYEFLNANAAADIHCLISDIQMPLMSGIEMYEQLFAKGYNVPTIFITAYPDAAPRLGVGTPDMVALLPKPCDADRLLDCIETALLQRH